MSDGKAAQSDYERGFLAGWRMAWEAAQGVRYPIQQIPPPSTRCSVCGLQMGAGRWDTSART